MSGAHLVPLVEPGVAAVRRCVGRHAGDQHRQVLVCAALNVEAKLASFVWLHLDGDEAVGALLTPSRLRAGPREGEGRHGEEGEEREER